MLLLANSPSALAIPTVFVTDGISSFTIVDNTGMDGDPTAGSVVFSTSIGNWFLVVTVGQTKPLIGSAGNPMLDLFTVQASSTAGGNLWVKFSDNNFTSPGPNAFASIGGTTDGTVVYNVFGDAGNVTLAQTTLLTSVGPFGPGSFSGDATAAAGFSGPYSLTLNTKVTHSGAGFTQYDANLVVPDGGLTVGLLGVAMLGLEAVRRVVGKRSTHFVAR